MKIYLQEIGIGLFFAAAILLVLYSSGAGGSGFIYQGL